MSGVQLSKHFLPGMIKRNWGRIIFISSEYEMDVSNNKTKNIPADTMLLEAVLSAALKMKVSINHEEGKEKGLISISYKSLDELDRISEMLINSS